MIGKGREVQGTIDDERRGERACRDHQTRRVSPHHRHQALGLLSLMSRWKTQYGVLDRLSREEKLRTRPVVVCRYPDLLRAAEDCRKEEYEYTMRTHTPLCTWAGHASHSSWFDAGLQTGEIRGLAHLPTPNPNPILPRASREARSDRG